MAAQDKMLELFSDMNGKIGELVAEIRAILVRLEKGDKKLEEHEERLDKLERAAVVRETAVEVKSSSGLRAADVMGQVVKWGGWVMAGLVLIIMKLVGVSTEKLPTVGQ